MRWRFGLTTAVGVMCLCTCISCARPRTGSYSEDDFGDPMTDDQQSPSFDPGTFVYETPEQKRTAERLFRLSAPFRACTASPKWENLTIEQVEVMELQKEKYDSGSGPLAGEDQVLFGFRTGDGLGVGIEFDPQDGVLRRYYDCGVSDRIRDDLQNDRWTMTELTPQEALAKAREYIQIARGSVPDDLIPVSVDYEVAPNKWERSHMKDWERKIDSKTGEWFVRFERYAGFMRYGAWPHMGTYPEGILVSFSERQGVHSYFDTYASESWEGEIKITREKAIEISAAVADAYFAEYLSEYGDDTPPLLLRRPPHIFDGRPTLMNVVEGNPRAVRAVWAIVYPYQMTGPNAGGHVDEEEWRAVFYIDAETAKVIPMPQVRH